MDYEKIRKMGDEELKNYLIELSKKGSVVCAKCGLITKREHRKTIIVGKSEKYNCALKTKKLCTFCDKCYKEFIAELGVDDVKWDSE